MENALSSIFIKNTKMKGSVSKYPDLKLTAVGTASRHPDYPALPTQIPSVSSIVSEV